MTIKNVLDPIYGLIPLQDYVWKSSKAPEVQRLREVRMCNINSLALTGAGGAHRFEHSLGTAYLAQLNVSERRSRFDSGESRLVVLAALLHDVVSAGFGHSVEYVLSEHGFEHDNLLAIESPRLRAARYDYKLADFQGGFFGRSAQLTDQIAESDLRKIAALIDGSGRLGPLISGSVDLDNVDNVYRLAHHMGIWKATSAPAELAAALYVDDQGLCINDSALEALNDWRLVRGEMYRWLLLDEDEFSAKAMLEAALRSANENSVSRIHWSDVDFELMEKLEVATPVSGDLAARIMTGDLFGTVGIFETVDAPLPTHDWAYRDRLVARLQKALPKAGSKRLSNLGGLAIHFIQDINKTDRRVLARTSSGRTVDMGAGVNRTLIGVFTTAPQMNADNADIHDLHGSGADEIVARELGKLLHTQLRTVNRPTETATNRLDYFA